MLGPRQHLRSSGYDLKALNIFNIESIFAGRGLAHPDGSILSLLLAGTWHVLEGSEVLA